MYKRQIHNAAARYVDKYRIRLHHSNALLADKPLGLRSERSVQGNDIRSFHQFVQRTVLNTNFFGFLVFGAAVTKQLAAKRLANFCNPVANSTGTNNSNGFSGQFIADQAVFGAARFGAVVAGENVAVNSKNKAEGEFCYGVGAIALRVGNNDAFFITDAGNVVDVYKRQAFCCPEVRGYFGRIMLAIGKLLRL